LKPILFIYLLKLIVSVSNNFIQQWTFQPFTTVPSPLQILSRDILQNHALRNLGVIFDSKLTFQNQIANITKFGIISLRSISRLSKVVSPAVLESLVHALSTSKLDYCNSLLINLPRKSLRKLQLLQNSTARLITKQFRSCHITPILRSLHWLPVDKWISYKILLLTFKYMHREGPLYLSDLVHKYAPPCRLRSSKSNQLSIPRSNLRTIGDRSFSVAAPTLWNSLPSSIRNSTCINQFKRFIKTYLFEIAYN
jgi:hypothetical protein